MGSIIVADNFIIAICIICCCCCCFPTMSIASTSIDSHANATKTDDLPAAQPFVDILILDYFRLERMLWQRIENRADNVLLQVYKSHEMFFDRVIGECGSGILGSNHLKIPNIEILVNIVASINGTTELGQTHLKEQILDRQSITDYASTGLKILKDASNLIDCVTKDNMWENIISVSVFDFDRNDWYRLWYQVSTRANDD